MATKLSTLINALSGKTTPVDADKIPALDSTSSNIFNYVTWANVKTTLKSYFDPLYLSTATTLAVTHGGTGLATVAASSVLVATTTDAINAVTLSSGTVLGQRATGTIVPISYANLKSDLAINVGSDTSGSLSIVSATSGTLTIDKGGTGLTTVAASSVLVATTTDAINAVTLSSGTVLGQRATGTIVPISYANLKSDLAINVGSDTSGSLSIVSATSGTLSVSKGGTGFGTIATNTVLICITADTLTPQSLSASQFIGRKSTGDTGALSAAEARTEIEAAACSTVSTGGASTSLSKATHQGKFIACTAATTLTITSVTAFDNWGECIVYAQGGIVTFTTGTATTLSVIGSKPTTLPLYGKATIQKTDAGHVYIATGEMA